MTYLKRCGAHELHRAHDWQSDIGPARCDGLTNRHAAALRDGDTQDVDVERGFYDPDEYDGSDRQHMIDTDHAHHLAGQSTPTMIVACVLAAVTFMVLAWMGHSDPAAPDPHTSPTTVACAYVGTCLTVTP